MRPISVVPLSAERKHEAVGVLARAFDRSPENVGFYQKFGFAVTDTPLIHGVLNYFMRRPLMR